MIGVDKIEDIRRRARAGEPVASIARHVGVSEPTVRKYARMVDLSPEPPSVRRDDRLLARRRLQELAQAAPHGHEGVRQAP